MRVEEMDAAIDALEQRRGGSRATSPRDPNRVESSGERPGDLDLALRHLRDAREELVRLGAGMQDMQNALDRERRRNTELFESAAEAAVRVDERDNIIAFNREAEKLFGYARGEIIGQSIEVLMPERLRAAHARQQAAYLAAPRERALGHDFELYARHRDGHEVPVEISLLPRQDPDGITITGIIRDMSARLASEREIARQRDMLRLITDSLPAMMAYVDRERRVTFANRAYREWFGIGDGDVGVVKLSGVLDRASYRRAEPFIECALKGEPAAYERPARHRDGTPATLQVTCVPDVARAGPSDGCFVLINDVTERRRAEETLRKTSRQLAHRVADLEALLDIVPVGVAIADDPACQHIRPNRELSQMLRIGPGVNASSTAPAGERPTHFTMTRNGVPIPLAELPMQLAASTGQPVLHSQMDIVFDDRATTSIYGQATPLFDADGNVRGAIGAFLDITDMRRIEDELRQANAVKDEFLGLVSHELKTPITTILGNAEVLQKRGDLLSEQDRAAALADIHDEASRLQGIIDNLLVLARLERSEQIEREPVLLQRIIEHVGGWHMRRNPHRTVQIRYEKGLPPVLAASMYVEQVVANLLSNAEKYSPAQMPIDIEIARDGARLRVSVSDRGVGIPADEIDRVFTAFYRSPRTAGHAQGFGIGLAVCKRLIEAQDGRVWVEPRGDGGTRFAFDLAVAPEGLM